MCRQLFVLLDSLLLLNCIIAAISTVTKSLLVTVDMAAMIQ